MKRTQEKRLTSFVIRKMQIKATSNRLSTKSDTSGWKSCTAVRILYTRLVRVSVNTIIWKTIWLYIVKLKM